MLPYIGVEWVWAESAVCGGQSDLRMNLAKVVWRVTDLLDEVWMWRKLVDELTEQSVGPTNAQPHFPFSLHHSVPSAHQPVSSTSTLHQPPCSRSVTFQTTFTKFLLKSDWSTAAHHRLCPHPLHPCIRWHSTLPLTYAPTYDHWRWDPQWLPKRQEIYLTHRAKSPKPKISNVIPCYCLAWRMWYIEELNRFFN